MTRASLFVSLNTVNIKGFRQILLPLGSRIGDSVYSMQDAFPKLLINLINLNSSKKRNHMFPPRVQAQCRLPIKDSLIETFILHSYGRTRLANYGSLKILKNATL